MKKLRQWSRKVRVCRVQLLVRLVHLVHELRTLHRRVRSRRLNVLDNSVRPLFLVIRVVMVRHTLEELSENRIRHRETRDLLTKTVKEQYFPTALLVKVFNVVSIEILKFVIKGNLFYLHILLM